MKRKIDDKALKSLWQETVKCSGDPARWDREEGVLIKNLISWRKSGIIEPKAEEQRLFVLQPMIFAGAVAVVLVLVAVFSFLLKEPVQKTQETQIAAVTQKPVATATKDTEDYLALNTMLSPFYAGSAESDEENSDEFFVYDFGDSEFFGGAVEGNPSDIIAAFDSTIVALKDNSLGAK